MQRKVNNRSSKQNAVEGSLFEPERQKEKLRQCGISKDVMSTAASQDTNHTKKHHSDPQRHTVYMHHSHIILHVPAAHGCKCFT